MVRPAPRTRSTGASTSVKAAAYGAHTTPGSHSAEATSTRAGCRDSSVTLVLDQASSWCAVCGRTKRSTMVLAASTIRYQKVNGVCRGLGSPASRQRVTNRRSRLRRGAIGVGRPAAAVRVNAASFPAPHCP
jgi:hypothetical protein